MKLFKTAQGKLSVNTGTKVSVSKETNILGTILKKTALNTWKEKHAQKECAMKDADKSVGISKIKPKDVGEEATVNTYTRK